MNVPKSLSSLDDIVTIEMFDDFRDIIFKYFNDKIIKNIKDTKIP